MTLTEQQTPAGRMLAFENVVFKNEPICDQANVTPSVQLPIKAQRVISNNLFARLSRRFSSRTNPIVKKTQQSNISPTSPLPPSSSTIERQNSSESDLSLSKLDLANEYSVVDGQDSLNTSRQTSELNLAESNSHPNTSQRLVRSVRTLFSRVQMIEKNSSSSTMNLCCCCCCFSTRTDSSDVPISSHQRFFT